MGGPKAGGTKAKAVIEQRLQCYEDGRETVSSQGFMKLIICLARMRHSQLPWL